MIRVLVLLFETPFQSGSEEIGRVRADLAAKQIERIAEPEVDVLLHDVERNASELTHIFVRILLHQLRSAFDDAAQARVADKHMMRFFGQHKSARARQRLETRFGQS